VAPAHAVGSLVQQPAAGIGSVYAGNLIVNGNAEYVAVNGQMQLGPGAAVADTVTAPPPDWTVAGTINEVKYGAEDDVPGPNDPGPPDRGSNFFWGGPDDGHDVHTARQSVDVSAAAADIDAGKVTFTLSGYFGGYSSQDDNTVLQAGFLGASTTAGTGGPVLLTAATKPVLAVDRGSNTGMLPRSSTGQVPAGTRSIVLTLIMTRMEGSDNDASADNLSLVLAPGTTPAPQTPTATSTPTTVATAAGTSTPTAAATSGVPCCAPQVYVTYYHRNGRRAVLGNHRLTVRVVAGPAVKATFAISLSAGRQLFAGQAQVVTDSAGRGSAPVLMTYNPRSPLLALLTVTVRTRDGTGTQRLAVEVFPG
jgi:hypothetical protein